MRQPRRKSALKRQVAVGVFLFGVSLLLPITPTQSSHWQISHRHTRLQIPTFAYYNYNRQITPQSPNVYEVVSTPTTSGTFTNTPTPSPTIISSFSSPVIIQPTNIQEVKSQPSTPKSDSLDPLFAQYATVYHLDVELLKRIAYCESRFNPKALRGQYAGLFQFSPATWIKERKRQGWNPDPDLRFSAEEAIKTGAAKIANGGIAAWPNCK